MNDDLTKQAAIQSLSTFHCEHPICIFNRAALYGMLRNGVFYAGTLHTSAVTIRYMFNRGVDTIYDAFGPSKHGVVWRDTNGRVLINEEQLNNFYTYDHGDKVFLFILAPCGKCDSCRVRRNLELVSRLNFEADCHDYLPLFVTLTYRDEYLPLDGVNKDDVQKFLKRLRNYFPHNNIRYFVASEYGAKRGRPHYHLIIYGLPVSLSSNEFTSIQNAICKAWVKPSYYRKSIDCIRHGSAVTLYNNQLGQVDVRVMKDRRMFAYVAKYLVKPQRVPKPYVNKTFSLRSLGLGRDVLSKFNLLADFRRCPCSPLQYRSTLYGDLVDFKPSSYFLKKLCPTFTQIIPSDMRNIFDAFNSIFRDLASHGYNPLNLYKYVLPYYKKYGKFGLARPCLYSPSKVGLRNSKRYIFEHYHSFVKERERHFAHVGIVPAVRCLLEDFVVLLERLKLHDSRLSCHVDLARYISDMQAIRREYMCHVFRDPIHIAYRSSRARQYLAIDERGKDGQ